MRRLPAWLLVTLVILPACAEPPNKEINQAQGAIDAARAAGAERYATDEYRAATDALKQANDAVTHRDYRLALNHALESRERAQSAARDAADSKARLRSEVERTMAAVAARLAQANARVAAVQSSRAPRRNLREAQQLLARVNADVQKAGAAVKDDDYAGAQPALAGVEARITQVLALLDGQPAARSPRTSR
jgi:hypothetical protein